MAPKDMHADLKPTRPTGEQTRDILCAAGFVTNGPLTGRRVAGGP